MIDSIFKNNQIAHNFHVTYLKLNSKSKIVKKEKYLTLSEAQLVVSDLFKKKGYKIEEGKIINPTEKIEILLNF